jgi:glutathione synthase/RimK-type ligase-like ATP-grasp enzyme
VQVISAKSYLGDPAYSELRGVKVFNLTRSYRYQSLGYYVSLLAEARGHKPLPNIGTIQEMRSPTLTRFVSEELDELIQKSLAPIQSKEFLLSVYFGKNLAKRYDRLSLNLFNLYPLPLQRARFVHNNRKWQLQNLAPVTTNDVPEDHWPFVIEMANEHFTGKRRRTRRRPVPRYDLAILHNPDDTLPPSDTVALRRFERAAEALDLSVEFITKDDYGRLAEFDALFIRETTSVNHHTYRFAQRAAAEGLVVIDDPQSILKCSNKVYLAEVLARHRVPTPRTYIISRDNVTRVAADLGTPCILKQPDSSFSQGVVKVEDGAAFEAEAERLLDKSDLIIAQSFLPTPFDWRVGVLDRKPIYVCRYYMAGRHWQVIQRDRAGRPREGRTDTLRVEDAPPEVVKTAVRAADLIGDGLYGVDLKEIDGKSYVIEVNDNPSIEGGVEDRLLKEKLYRTIMETFVRRIEEHKGIRREHE